MSFALPVWAAAAAAVVALAAWRARDRRAWCEALSIALLLLALSGPRLQPAATPHERPLPCVVVLDASRSMLARDVAPDRFGAACARIAARVRGEAGRRFGLVAFAGSAWTVAPPTADGDALLALLAELDPRRVARPGSAAHGGVATALDRLEAEGGGELWLLTDGEWDGEALDPLAQRARAAGITFVAEAVGTAEPTAIDDGDAPSAVSETTTAQPERVAALASPPADASPPPRGAPPFGPVTGCALAAFLCALLSHRFGGREP